VEEINDLYGSNVKAEECAYALHIIDDLLSNVVTGVGSGAPKREDAAILKRLLAVPTEKFPRGRVLTWAHDEFLQETDLPDGFFPFVPLDWFYIPGAGQPMPFMTPIRDPQKHYNITLSQLIEVKNRQLRGDFAVQGEGMVTQKVNPDTGAKTVNIPMAMKKWELMTYSMNTTEAELLLAEFINEMRHMAGIRDPSTGEPIGRSTTATEVLALQEKDVQGLALFRKGFDQAHSHIGKQKLLVAREHYDVPRMLRVVAQDAVLLWIGPAGDGGCAGEAAATADGG
jgi:hypothetical protein